ncbi:MAG: FG-GAP-like repeat-containing protein [Dongiaceae bacterium]
MSLTINSNLAASISTRTVQQTDRAMSDSLAKLASGQRVPNARYDTAALSISGRIRGQIVSLQAAVTNVTQASSLLQTVDATYQRVQDMLYRMRDLSTQAQGSQLSTVERGMLNTEFQQLKTEITRLANGTTFGATALFAVGNMSFHSGTNYALAGSPMSVNSGDFNGDGILDILSVVATTAIQLSLGNSDGTFQAAQTVVASQSSITNLVLGDFNGDGRTDFITSAATGLIYFGNSNGTVTQSGSIAYGGPNSVTSGDINGDGIVDIIASVGTNINVYYGNGNGTFQSAVTSAIGTAFSQLVVADTNNDTILDIVALDSANRQVRSLYGNGAGAFTSGTASATFGQILSRMQVVDMNNDGFLDVFIGESNGISSTYVLTNTGQGNWNASQTITLGSVNLYARAVDFNNDGFMDIISVNDFGQTYTYRQGTGNLTFANAVTSSSQGSNLGYVEYADFNNDGRMDFVTRAGNGFRAILNQATSGLEGSVRVGAGVGSGNDISYRSFSVALNSLAQGLSSSLITQTGSAKRATETVIAAIDQLLRYRANIGALLNRLEKVGQNLDTLLENNELARSSLMDVDAAEEMSKFISLQILKDAGISMLAQSNVTHKNILALLDIAPQGGRASP